MFDIKRVTHKVIARLPTWTKTSLAITPKWPLELLAEQVFNQVFSEPLQQHEFAFLSDAVVVIVFEDIHLAMEVTLKESTSPALRVRLSTQPQRFPDADVRLTGNFNHFILMIAQRVDPDTLFFRRKLRIQGDTELGLAVKNLLDTIDVQDQLPTPGYNLLNLLADQLEDFQAQATAS
ncbi:hypothetical protein FM042_01910 [Aliidiomarina halalkaliphila]|uniref:SCP2 domain-containing protein n=1 Tax=Aliidiomarina halalkaliphila TaxID=2593535 RepID=A0A552X4W6_9GAMM|nr:hypothetical protein FM042_01910 [Aliidiomarina halalkaliphila]